MKQRNIILSLLLLILLSSCDSSDREIMKLNPNNFITKEKQEIIDNNIHLNPAQVQKINWVDYKASNAHSGSIENLIPPVIDETAFNSLWRCKSLNNSIENTENKVGKCIYDYIISYNSEFVKGCILTNLIEKDWITKINNWNITYQEINDILELEKECIYHNEMKHAEKEIAKEENNSTTINNNKNNEPTLADKTKEYTVNQVNNFPLFETFLAAWAWYYFGKNAADTNFQNYLNSDNRKYNYNSSRINYNWCEDKDNCKNSSSNWRGYTYSSNYSYHNYMNNYWKSSKENYNKFKESINEFKKQETTQKYTKQNINGKLKLWEKSKEWNKKISEQYKEIDRLNKKIEADKKIKFWNENNISKENNNINNKWNSINNSNKWSWWYSKSNYGSSSNNNSQWYKSWNYGHSGSNTSKNSSSFGRWGSYSSGFWSSSLG